MKLAKFRVQNYKKIRDTDWVSIGNLTVLVGKNEAGKSALLRGLSKLKPTDGEKYNPIKEFPHSRFTDEFNKQDWPVASGRYALEDHDRQALGAILPSLGSAQSVTAIRHYSDQLHVEFDPPPALADWSAAVWAHALGGIKSHLAASVAPDGRGDAWTPVKTQLLAAVDAPLKKWSAPAANAPSPSVGDVEGLLQQFQSHASEEWRKALLQGYIDGLNAALRSAGERDRLAKAKGWVGDNLPFFLYFGNYEVLESAIYLPEFLARAARGDAGSKTRVQHALFKHVGVDISKIAELGRHPPGQGDNPQIRQQIDELNIRADSASHAMTDKFTEWYEQRRHRFHYQFQGDYFRVWVSDDLDRNQVELEERSQGMRYFFSFYLLFIVEAQEKHRNCILLLDEPGLHLHGTAQEKLIQFLDKISKDNQLIYSTHSPFMIDGRRLERAKAVSETPGGTQVSADVWPKDRDTLFPLQAALGYSVCQSLFLSRRQTLVEGPTDYMLLHALNDYLKARGEAALRDDVILVPVGGASNLAPLASLLAGHEIDLVILLDSDRAAQSAKEKVKRILTELGDTCLQAHQFSEDGTAEEFEALIPEAYYLDAVMRAYPDTALVFNREELMMRNVVDRVQAFRARLGKEKMDKRRPAQVICDDLYAGKATVPPELVAVARRVFERINRAFDSIRREP